MRYNYNLELFKTKNDIFYYILGILLTDGNIFVSKYVNKIQLTSKDEDWILLLQKEIRCPAYPTKDGHKNLTINSKPICNILLQSGCLPNKSLTNRVPFIPDEYIPDFLRGCIDGDGSIPKGKTKQASLCSSSKEFLDDVQNILHIKHIKSHIYTIEKTPYTLQNGKTITPKNPHYRLMITGNAVKQLLTWIYYPNHQLSMPRKNTIAQRIIYNS